MKNLLLTLALLAGGASAQTAAQSVTTTTSTPQTSTAPSSEVYPSGYTFRQMLDALGALKGVNLRGVGFDDRGYLNLTVADDAAREQAIAQVAAAGLPTGVLAFGGVPVSGGTQPGTATEAPASGNQTPAAQNPAAPQNSSLPTNGAPLAQAHRAELSGPQVVRAGEANTWSFNLTNTGSNLTPNATLINPLTGQPYTNGPLANMPVGTAAALSGQSAGTANTGAAASAPATAATIIADKRTNTLIVRGTPEQVAQIAELVPTLDTRVPQINVQIRIQEITETAARSLGVDWKASFGGFSVTAGGGGAATAH